MHKWTLILLFFSCGISNAQKTDSIYVHLYTDSLKKGTYNYINVDARLENGRYMPLDSTEIIFSSSYGKFFGNSLWLEPECREEKITIHAILKKNTAIRKDFTMYVKKKDDPSLKTEQEIKNETRPQRRG